MRENAGETAGGGPGTDSAPSPPAQAFSIIGTDDRIRIADAGAFPWSAIAQLTLATEAGTVRATGVMIGPRHMLTAGHAVLDDAYGGDGWATSATARFGDLATPELTLSAGMVGARVLPGWESGRDIGADLALVTLDRSIGTLTGWYEPFAIAIPDFFEGVSVNLAGYPTDVGNGDALMLSVGEVAESDEERLRYGASLDTAAGMSGAPIWQFFASTGERQLIGIHTTGVSDPDAPGALNGGTRLTADRLGLIEEWQGQDLFLNPVDDRPDLVAMPSPAVEAIRVLGGAPVTLGIDVTNIGTLASTPVEVTAYLSPNSTISVFDIPVGSETLPGLAPLAVASLEIAGTLPDALPTGTFYIGWIIDPEATLSEFDIENNRGLSPDTLEVDGDVLTNLAGSGLVLSSTAWSAGDVITMGWIVSNTGAIAAPAVGSALFVSPDPVVTPADRRLLDDPLAPALAPGGISFEGQPGTVVVPADLAVGTWYVAAIVDPDGAVAEADEEDNRTEVIEIAVVNAPPVAVPDSANVAAGGAVTVPVLANDRDPEGAALILVAVSPAGHGRVSIEGESVVYRPITGFSGSDAFGYVVRDAAGAATSAMVAVSVAPPPLGIDGSPGDDRLLGTAAGEPVAGLGGADLLDGRGGADTLAGGEGDDTLFGGPDGDLIEAGPGADLGFGGPGEDTLLGAAGADRLFGEAGDDRLEGGAEADHLEGGAGDDTLDGGDGGDTLIGGDGADSLAGGPGADLVLAGEGADTLDGGAGADSLSGGASADSFVFAEGDGADTIADFDPAEDAILLSGGLPEPVFEVVEGTVTLVYGSAGDTVALPGVALEDVLAAEALVLD